MRNLTLLASGALVAFTLSTGCKWTDFDALETEMWAESVEKPDSNSNDYGIAMTRSQRVSTDGGTVTVLGSGQALYTELEFKAAGGGSLVPATEEKLTTLFGLGSLDPHPILIAATDTDDVALVTNATGDNSIAILAGSHALMASQVFGPKIPDAAVYFKAASQPTSKVFVGALDSVYGFSSGTQPKCPLVDDAGTAIAIAGMTNVRLPAATDDDLAVLAKDGKVYFYAGASAFDGTACSPSLAPLFPGVDISFPGALHNAPMFTVDSSHFLIVGAYVDGGDQKSTQAVIDLSGAAPVLVGTPLGKAGMKSMAFLEVDAGKFLLAGFPNEDIDGTSGGEVLAFPFNETTGVLNPTPTMILHDAQPTSNQLFGRSIAVVQYNGVPAIAVGASNEVFFYYHASPLYGETRRR